MQTHVYFGNMPSLHPYKSKLRHKASAPTLTKIQRKLRCPHYGRFNVCDAITLADSSWEQSCWSCRSWVTQVDFSPQSYDVISVTPECLLVESYLKLPRPLQMHAWLAWLPCLQRCFSKHSAERAKSHKSPQVGNISHCDDRITSRLENKSDTAGM